MGVTVTVAGLGDLLTDLGAADAEVRRQAPRVVGRGCGQIKADWRRRWQGHPRIRHLPWLIACDLDTDGDLTVGEVGPDHLRSQGPLAHIIELGSPTSAPIPGGLPALAAEEPRFLGAAGDMGQQALDRR